MMCLASENFRMGHFKLIARVFEKEPKMCLSSKRENI